MVVPSCNDGFELETIGHGKVYDAVCELPSLFLYFSPKSQALETCRWSCLQSLIPQI